MRKHFSKILLVICVGVLIYNAWFITNWFLENKSANEALLDAKQVYSEQNEPANKIDGLITKYPDVVGILRVKGTNIDYPVAQTKDNDFYLTHLLNGKKNSAGNPFLDFRNKLDDKNLVIYGHNRKDGSQFGSLKRILNNEWKKGNNTITWTTKNGAYTYQVFSTYIIKNENYFNQTSLSNDFSSFLTTIKARSNYKYNVSVNESDNLLTLSTCYGMSSLDKRLVVHAKLIK